MPFVGITDAQPRDRHHVRRNPEQVPKVVLAIERHPADPDPLGASRKPQVLDRQAGAVQVGVVDRVPAEDLLPRLAIAADDDADRRLTDPLELEVQVIACAVVEVLALDQPLPGCEPLHRRLCRLLSDHHEPPRLHQPDRRRPVSRLKQPAEQLVFDRVGAEATNIPTFGDGAEHASALRLGKSERRRVAATVGGARGVEVGR